MVAAARTASQVVVHMGVAFVIMYAFTGSIAFGGLAAVLEPICVVGVLPLHDRAWRILEDRIAARAQARGDGNPAEVTARLDLAQSR